jgi:uncharacterized membrane protein
MNQVDNCPATLSVNTSEIRHQEESQEIRHKKVKNKRKFFPKKLLLLLLNILFYLFSTLMIITSILEITVSVWHYALLTQTHHNSLKETKQFDLPYQDIYKVNATHFAFTLPLTNCQFYCRWENSIYACSLPVQIIEREMFLNRVNRINESFEKGYLKRIIHVLNYFRFFYYLIPVLYLVKNN